MQTWVALGDLLPAFSQGWPCTVFAYVTGVLTMHLQEAGLRTQPWHPSWTETGFKLKENAGMSRGVICICLGGMSRTLVLLWLLVYIWPVWAAFPGFRSPAKPFDFSS